MAAVTIESRQMLWEKRRQSIWKLTDQTELQILVTGAGGSNGSELTKLLKD